MALSGVHEKKKKQIKMMKDRTTGDHLLLLLHEDSVHACATKFDY